MKEFRNVLVVQQSLADTSALRRGLRLAEEYGAKLTVLRVLRNLSWPLTKMAGLRNVDLSELLASEAKSELGDLIGKMDSSAVEPEVVVTWGTAVVEVIRAVLREDYDLVIKTAGLGKELSGARLFGATDMQLMRKCPCPVWIIKPEPETACLSKIMVAVDPDPDDVAKTELNHAILKLAIIQAERRNAQLYVVHAWEFPGESFLKGPRSTLSAADVDGLVEEMQSDRRRAVDVLLAGCDLKNIRHEVVLVRGFRHSALANYATEKGIGLIVMGTVCRTGLSQMLIGNTAENVLQLVSCSVLTVKPPGFNCPVKLEA